MLVFPVSYEGAVRLNRRNRVAGGETSSPRGSSMEMAPGGRRVAWALLEQSPTTFSASHPAALESQGLRRPRLGPFGGMTVHRTVILIRLTPPLCGR
jgi:hypothetical protein